MNQKERDIHYLSIAETIAKGSRCQKRGVGSVLVDQFNRIISTGVNGRPRNCDRDDEPCKRLNIPSGEQLNICCCLHSEQNCVIYADFYAAQFGTMYITIPPCELCAPIILQLGISRLVCYEDPHYTKGLEEIKRLTYQSDRLKITLYKKESSP